jgi:hypothetical protein
MKITYSYNKAFKFTKIITIIIIITIILGKIESKQYCGSWLPKDETSCNLYTTNTTLCCYLTTFSNDIYFNMCYPIERNKYLYLDNKITIGDYEFKMNCGNGMGTICGSRSHPKSYRDCSLSSKSDNSCCYTEYQGNSLCVWLNSRYNGKINKNGITLVCSKGYLKSYSLYAYFFIFLIYLILLIN